MKIREDLDKAFAKLAKKDPIKLQIINKKIKEILEDPHRYKNLRKPLNNWKRVHIDSHFVLTFSVDENTVVLEDYDHHDNIYR